MIIDKFKISEQAKEGCDYVATGYIIDKSYELKVGDYLYECSYGGRGCCEGYDAKIIDINERGITLDNNYKKKFIPWKDGERKLIIQPFPEFRNGINKKSFNNRTNTIEDFALYEHYNRSRKLHWDSSWYDKYLNNFKNLDLDGEIGVQQKLNLRMNCCI